MKELLHGNTNGNVMTVLYWSPVSCLTLCKILHLPHNTTHSEADPDFMGPEAYIN